MGAHFVFIYPQIKRLTGAQRLILSLAGALTGLPDRPVRVTILTHRFAAECRPALPPSVELIESGRNLNLTGNHYLDSLIEYGAVPSLLKLLPDGVSAICFFGPPSLPGLWWARRIGRLKIPLLYFCYEPPRAAYTDRQEVSRRMGRLGWVMSPLFRLYRPLDRYLTRQASRVLVNGEYGRQLIAQTYDLSSTIITHGADLTLPTDLAGAVQQLRQQYNLTVQPVVLTVNHLHPRKRIELLLRALPPVLAVHPTAVTLVVGSGPEAAALQMLGRELGLSRSQLIFCGFVPDEALAAYYAAADVYVHTGRAETFGLSVLEAGSLGLPVVAANEGGPCEILLDGRTGFLIEPVAALFAEKINWLLAHPTEKYWMGQQAAERANSCYTWRQGALDFLEAVDATL